MCFEGIYYIINIINIFDIFHEIFQALENYKLEDMTLDQIPELYRDGFALPVPQQQGEEDIVCILDLEVPGECFMQLLSKINMSSTEDAADLLSHHISIEVDEFRQGVYSVPENQAEPMNYKVLPKKSILKAVVHHLIHEATTTKQKTYANSEFVTINCLKILSKQYSKPLPPLNWCFLHEFVHQDLAMKSLCVKIAGRQMIISGTAKRLVDNFLVNVDVDNEV